MKFHLALFLLPAMSLMAAAAPTTQSGTREAYCVVDVWANINAESVTRELLREMGPAAHDILGIAPDALQEYVIMENIDRGNLAGHTDLAAMQNFVRMGQQRIILSVILDDHARPEAKEFMDKMIEALPGAIDRAQRGPLEDQLDDIVRARQEIAEQEQRAKQLTDYLRSVGLVGRTPADIQAMAKSLDDQKQSLNLDVAALNAERDVLSKAVDKINAEAEEKAAVDPVAKELETIVDAKEKKLDMMKSAYRAAAVPSTDLADAETAAAEARVELLERREAVIHAAGGDALADFQKQLVMVEVNLAQDKARLDAMETQLTSLNKALELAQDNAAAANAGRFGGGFGGGGRGPGDISDTAINNIERQLNAIPKAAVRVVKESSGQ